MCQCIYKKDFFRFRCGPLEFFTGSISWPDEAWGGGVGWYNKSWPHLHRRFFLEIRYAVLYSMALSMFLYEVGFLHPIFGFARHQHGTWTLDLSTTRDGVIWWACVLV